jgi:hypothetical protein
MIASTATAPTRIQRTRLRFFGSSGCAWAAAATASARADTCGCVGAAGSAGAAAAAGTDRVGAGACDGTVDATANPEVSAWP